MTKTVHATLSDLNGPSLPNLELHWNSKLPVIQTSCSDRSILLIWRNSSNLARTSSELEAVRRIGTRAMDSLGPRRSSMRGEWGSSQVILANDHLSRYSTFWWGREGRRGKGRSAYHIHTTYLLLYRSHGHIIALHTTQCCSTLISLMIKCIASNANNKRNQGPRVALRKRRSKSTLFPFVWDFSDHRGPFQGGGYVSQGVALKIRGYKGGIPKETNVTTPAFFCAPLIPSLKIIPSVRHIAESYAVW